MFNAPPMFSVLRLRLLTYLLWLVYLAPSALAEITVTGIGNSDRREILNHLKTLDIPCDANRNHLQKQVDDTLQQGLRALGYFNAHWHSELREQGTCWQLQLDITPGPPLIIRTADIQILGAAARDPAFATLIDQARLNAGDKFSNTHYETLKERIQAKGLRRGYFDASFNEQRIDIYPTTNSADIHLTWDSGERYRYGEIKIEQSVLRQELFSDLLTIKSGAFYDLSEIQNDQLRLHESRYFAALEIKPLPEQRENGQLPVHIQAAPGDPSSYQVGVGFSTDTGARLRGDYTRHRFNQRGHKGEASLLLSEVLQTLSFNYRIPWGDPKTDNLQADIAYIDENNDAFISQRWETSLAANRKLPSGWNRSISTTLSTERSEVADEVDRSIHLVPAVSLSKIDADDLIYPSRGYSLSLTLSGSAEGVISDSSFLQAKTSLKLIRKLPFQLRLLTRAELGFTLADSIEDLPASRRFFSGGDNSIRGYDYRSLGPTEDGEVIGGRHLATASIELERPVYEKWSMAAFVDGGNAWDIDDLDPVIGVGLGVRWHSPIGPLRVDIGVPLEKDRSGFRIHLNLGPEL